MLNVYMLIPMLYALEGTGSSAITDAISTVLTQFTNNLTLANIGTLIATALGFALPFVLFWFGYRFLTRKATGAFKKGRM